MFCYPASRKCMQRINTNCSIVNSCFYAKPQKHEYQNRTEQTLNAFFFFFFHVPRTKHGMKLQLMGNVMESRKKQKVHVISLTKENRPDNKRRFFLE